MPDDTPTSFDEEDGRDYEVIEALIERFFWERIDTLTKCVYPYKKDRQPLQAGSIAITVDAEPTGGMKHRAVRLSYHGCTVSASIPDVLADYMEQEKPFHRLLGRDSANGEKEGR